MIQKMSISSNFLHLRSEAVDLKEQNQTEQNIERHIIIGLKKKTTRKWLC